MKQQYLKINVILGVLAVIFIARLVYLQLITDKYVLNALNTSIKTEYIIPQRGIVFDRNGKLLVGTRPAYEISFTEAMFKKNFDTLGFCSLLNITVQDFVERLEAVRQEKYYSKITPMTFIKNLNSEEVARIQEIIFMYPAFDIVQRYQREYYVHTSGNLLGYTSEVNQAEIKKDSLYYLPGDIIGKAGVEKAYEKTLRGEKGVRYIQKDIRQKDIGSYKDGTLDKEVVSGKDITLTIDYDLQKMAEEMLVNKHGAIVALDPSNGEILVMATGPDINPGLFTGPEKSKNLYRLAMDTIYNNKPTFDRSIQGSYPPGSTFKLLTALAGMHMGVMDEKTVFPCGRGFYYRGMRVRGHGGADPLVPSIKVSSNCYFSYAFIAMMNKYPGDPGRGVDEWKSIMSSFGLGRFLNNDLAVGSRGFIPDGEFYRKKSGGKKDWSPYYTVNGSILNGMGQGDVSLTPLQMANFTAAIANEGWFYTPHIVKSIDGKPNPDSRFKNKNYTLVRNKKFYREVKKGMEQVVLGGTARALRTSDFTQLAKTGTAQVPQGKDNSIYVLAAPAEHPKIVVAAVMEHAGFGATWAGPAATAIAEKYLLGTLKREHLYKKMITSSFMPEYKRQWIATLKRKGLYVEPGRDSLRVMSIEDSLKIIQDEDKKKQLISERDSLRLKLQKIQK